MTYISLHHISLELLDFFSNSLVGFVVLVLFIFSFVKRANDTLLGAWFANLMGVFFHEVAHASIGRILNAKPINFTIIPKKLQTEDNKTMYLLGHVDFKNIKWYNAFPSAMAPLLLLFIAFYIEDNFYSYFKETLLSFTIYTYLLIVFIINAIPSNQDFKVAFSSFFGAIFWISIIVLIFYYRDLIEYYYHITIVKYAILL